MLTAPSEILLYPNIDLSLLTAGRKRGRLVRFVYVGLKSKKLLKVTVDNLGYFLGPNGLSGF